MLTIVMRSIWPIFLGILFISLGNGLQGTLSSWRADYEGFSVITTGLVMSGYFLGAFASSMLSPAQIKKNGPNQNLCRICLDRFNGDINTNIVYRAACLVYFQISVWFLCCRHNDYCRGVA